MATRRSQMLGQGTPSARCRLIAATFPPRRACFLEKAQQSAKCPSPNVLFHALIAFLCDCCPSVIGSVNVSCTDNAATLSPPPGLISPGTKLIFRHKAPMLNAATSADGSLGVICRQHPASADPGRKPVGDGRIKSPSDNAILLAEASALLGPYARPSPSTQLPVLGLAHARAGLNW
jgi:hypothetical protein